tara:strand:- start:117 stop:275 length:159 start_codon:yes stop_codon:yes gene_type:complete
MVLDILTERNSTGMPPLIKSGGVLASNSNESNPLVGEEDGANGGDEKVGRLR